MNSDTGKVVVLGGSSGIGLATVRRLAGAGYEVIATGRDADKLQTVAASIKGSVRVEAFDGAQRDQLERFFTSIGTIDHLVIALSGGEGAGAFKDLDLASLRRGFDAKFWPHIQAAQTVLPTLRKGGSITFVTAISARIANPGTSGLAAINAAIEAMVPVLARELAPTRVNAVSPGVVETAWWNAMPDAARRAFFEQHASELPVGRVGQPDDVAQAIAYLIGNGYTTGSIMECDGGLHLL
ncbi:short-chain dehydrogenase [Burkholderia cepacia]|uniref:Short-chain dehydrogenase n=1 Tax=Burkholderia cepacia TaxID=292 RepID=A0A0J5WF72_BURCE|nr:SDR family oxidoreductase [Burkholderia cepacia]KML45655.1 short-chain dehydrogenase [Burkholderia cepacia]